MHSNHHKRQLLHLKTVSTINKAASQMKTRGMLIRGALKQTIHLTEVINQILSQLQTMHQLKT